MGKCSTFLGGAILYVSGIHGTMDYHDAVCMQMLACGGNPTSAASFGSILSHNLDVCGRCPTLVGGVTLYGFVGYDSTRGCVLIKSINL